MFPAQGNLEQEENFARVFQMSTAAMSIIDAQTERFVEANGAFLSTLGYAHDELVGKTSLELNMYVHLPEREAFFADIERCGLVEGRSVTIRAKDGSARIAQISATVIHFKGRPHILTVARDITQQTLLESQLVRKRNRYQQLLELVPSAIVTLDSERRIRDWNRMAEAITGFTQEEVVGKTCDVFALPSCTCRCVLLSQEASAPLLGQQCQIRHKSGRLVTVLKNVAKIVNPDTGLFEGGIETFEDITGWLKLEQERLDSQSQLLHAAKLASIGTLAGGVAHEINNPLAVLSGNAHRLSGNPSRAEQARIVERIQNAVKRIARIVSALRTYARQDDDDIGALDLHHAIRETLTLAEPLFREDSITLTIHVESSIPNVRGNTGKLQQVLMNLLTNARDALEGVPPPKVIGLELSCRDKTVCLEVSDNGHGIDAETLPHIFDPFFTTKPVGKGTGLGLSIAQSIVASFGGTLSARSQPGKGTSFTMMLPIFVEDATVPGQEEIREPAT